MIYPAQAIAIEHSSFRSVLSRLPVLLQLLDRVQCVRGPRQGYGPVPGYAAVGPCPAARVRVCVQLQVKQRLGLAQVYLRKVQARNAIS